MNIRPTSPDRKCHNCGETMFRRYDTFGEYFACFRQRRCIYRINGAMYRPYYREQFNTPYDPALGLWRHKAHLVFDKLWQEKGLTRPASYRVLQKIMRKSEEDAHISKFTTEECRYLVNQLKAHGDAILVLHDDPLDSPLPDAQ